MIDSKVRHLYKQFIFLARDYPGGLETARAKIKAAFRAVPTDDPQAVKKALVTGKYRLKELEGLIKLHKYRAMLTRYSRRS